MIIVGCDFHPGWQQIAKARLTSAQITATSTLSSCPNHKLVQISK
jgi:hypothetical protein